MIVVKNREPLGCLESVSSHLDRATFVVRFTYTSPLTETTRMQSEQRVTLADAVGGPRQ